MLKNTLIILLIIIIASVYYCYSSPETFTGGSSRLKQVVGNRGTDVRKKIEVHHASATEIGTDEDIIKFSNLKDKCLN